MGSSLALIATFGNWAANKTGK